MSAASTSSSASRDVSRAVSLMAASTVMFGLMAVCIRLASAQLHAFEIAFFRNLFGFVFTLPLLYHTGLGVLKTKKLPLYVVRCVIGLIGMLAGFWSMVHLPLAQAVALSYSTPLFATIAAVLVLGEVVRLRRWTAVLIGFVGLLLIVRPGSSDFSLASLVAVLAAVMSATVTMSIKFLARTEHPNAIVIYTTALWVPMSLLPALAVWEMPVGITWLWIVLAGFLGTAAHWAWTRALKLGDASMLSPISFLQILVVVVFGWWLFDEPLDRWTAFGALIIFTSNIYIARREAQLARQSQSQPQSQQP